jgi:hypothetical protein
MLKFLQGYKTYIIGAFTIAFALVGLYLHFISVDAAAQLISTALVGMGLRSSLATALVSLLRVQGVELPPNPSQVAVKKAVAAAAPVARRVAPLFMVCVLAAGMLVGCAGNGGGGLTPQQTLQAVEAGFGLAEATYDAICSVNTPPAFCTDPSDQVNYAKAKAALEAAFQTAQAAITASGNLDSASVDQLLQAVSDDWAAYNKIVNAVQAKNARLKGVAYHPIPLR